MYQSAEAFTIYITLFTVQLYIFKDRYLVGFGTYAGQDNIVANRELTSSQIKLCVQAELEHNHTYYATVTAINGALRQLNVTSSSDGGKTATWSTPMAGTGINTDTV